MNTDQTKAAEILREGWKAYEQDLQLHNGKKMREWSDKKATDIAKGIYTDSSPPYPKQATLNDFRYWVWQSGDYEVEAKK